ncbi:MAG TPA: glycosyltransferase family 4 protein [Gemmatimonadaceae bacterium]|nr:glycosyltransferase family 4 protein [Gemmatimonadaceae bacterium]
MRVALVCDWFLPRQGGIELHLRDLALALRRRGVDARVVTTTPGAEEVEGVPVHRVRAALAPGAGFAYTPRAMARLGEVIRGEAFDVVHAHVSVVSPVAYAGVLAGARAGAASVVTFHSMLHRSSFLLGASEALLSWARGRILLSAVSSVVAAQAARWIPGAGVCVLPNGIDVPWWRAGDWAPPARDEVVCVSAMRLSRKKRPERLLRAFASAVRFTAGSPALRLILAGDGPEGRSLRRLADSLGLGSQVELPGHLDRTALRELYHRAHVFVLPSERESFGIAALEARAAGLPVVAMLAGGARDFIVSGVDGLLARDEAELARGISRLAIEAPFREYVAAHNRAVPPDFDWPDVADLHLRYYGEAAALRERAPRASQP